MGRSQRVLALLHPLLHIGYKIVDFQIKNIDIALFPKPSLELGRLELNGPGR
jgi:hypothetical protein